MAAVVSEWNARLTEELAAVAPVAPAIRAAQVATLTRLAGNLHADTGTAVLELELDRRAVAERWRSDVHGLYGYPTHIHTLRAETPDKAGRHVVRVTQHASILARQTGLIDHRRRPVRGMPAHLVRGGINDITALWRGALMARGELSDPRRATVSVRCPTVETAMAMVGAARRLDIAAKARENSAGAEVTVRDADTITVLLTRVGAPHTAQAWTTARHHSHATRRAGQNANFDTANAHRTQVTAAIAAARVRRAFDILGDATPAHLVECGQLRLAHPEATLEEIGRRADPPLTKDAAAGRIRRLLAAADTHATTHNIPTTDAAVTPDLLNHL